MKLPDKLNKYKFNQYCEEIKDDALNLALAHVESESPEEICRKNLFLITSIHAKILHLELVIDEVLKLENKNE